MFTVQGWDDAEQFEVLISALEHWSYCPRQCALIHVEQSYDENQYTIRGRHLHERVDRGEESSVRGVTVLRAIPLWSERWGLRGKADAVELRPEGPYPVEYKSGRRRGIHADIQLCAQALCLEEMLGTAVTHGAVYYGLTHERVEVAIDAALRERTVTTIAAVRAMLTEQAVPAAANDARCRRCSLVNACLPDVLAAPDRVSRGMDGLFRPLPLARGQVMPVGDSQDIDDADGDDEPVMCGGHDGAGLNRNRVG